MANQRGDRLTVKIESLAVGGRGVARHHGLVIFVADTAPQELVEVELTSVKKNFAEAQLLKILEPSPVRVESPCPVANVCGGCNWQHVAYEEQLKQKRSIVEQSMQRFSGFELEEGFVEPVVPSPSPFRYRNRIQLHHKPGAKAQLGFFKRGSHAIVDIDDCLITEEAITCEFKRLKKDLAHSPPGRVELLIEQSGAFAMRTSTQEALNSADQDDSASASVGPAFAQVNTAQNIALVEYVVGIIRDFQRSSDSSKAVVFDLFAGSGNFTFPLAEALPSTRIVGVELNKASVQTAHERIKDLTRQDGAPVEFVQDDVSHFLLKQPSSVVSRATVLLDPPRSGCAPEVMHALAQARPISIVYVSCHPVTLARDLKTLREAGYDLLHLRPFDMFPQTDHVESVAVLKLSGRASY